MSLEAEVPVISLLRLMHFGITFFVLALGRWRRCDQGCIDDRSLAHDQTLVGQMSVERRKNLGCAFVLFEQAAEPQQRRRVVCRLAIKDDADEVTDRLAVLNRVCDSFVGQAETLLRHIHAWHACQANRRANLVRKPN